MSAATAAGAGMDMPAGYNEDVVRKAVIATVFWGGWSAFWSAW